eukprot:CAMPEP_0114557858 /NCGR_PEP_ID=MMETSP0114-20121206/10058_1 /TAXON_ID=31324 /ORGANISM="Goniomonas sp, Strain m" /LENGTH=357 /DNA_ID=CAMNT_0001743181 /DNA_START=82 /DNA_END=1152 /DNA_ORIENTATION=-
MSNKAWFEARSIAHVAMSSIVRHAVSNANQVLSDRAIRESGAVAKREVVALQAALAAEAQRSAELREILSQFAHLPVIVSELDKARFTNVRYMAEVHGLKKQIARLKQDICDITQDPSTLPGQIIQLKADLAFSELRCLERPDAAMASELEHQTQRAETAEAAEAGLRAQVQALQTALSETHAAALAAEEEAADNTRGLEQENEALRTELEECYGLVDKLVAEQQERAEQQREQEAYRTHYEYTGPSDHLPRAVLANLASDIARYTNGGDRVVQGKPPPKRPRGKSARVSEDLRRRPHTDQDPDAVGEGDHRNLRPAWKDPTSASWSFDEHKHHATFLRSPSATAGLSSPLQARTRP